MTLRENYRVALTIIRQHKPLVDFDDDLQEIIDDYQIENVRICEHCHKPHIMVYILDDCENFCSKRCLTLHGINDDEDWYWTEYL